MSELVHPNFYQYLNDYTIHIKGQAYVAAAKPKGIDEFYCCWVLPVSQSLQSFGKNWSIALMKQRESPTQV